MFKCNGLLLLDTIRPYIGICVPSAAQFSLMYLLKVGGDIFILNLFDTTLQKITKTITGKDKRTGKNEGEKQSNRIFFFWL